MDLVWYIWLSTFCSSHHTHLAWRIRFSFGNMVRWICFNILGVSWGWLGKNIFPKAGFSIHFSAMGGGVVYPISSMKKFFWSKERGTDFPRRKLPLCPPPSIGNPERWCNKSTDYILIFPVFLYSPWLCIFYIEAKPESMTDWLSDWHNQFLRLHGHVIWK